MSPDLPVQCQPIDPDDRDLYVRLRRRDGAAMTHGAAIIACWDAERERLDLPAIPPLPPSRGLVAYHMPGAARLHQGSRPDSADNRAWLGVSPMETSPALQGVGAFSGGIHA